MANVSEFSAMDDGEVESLIRDAEISMEELQGQLRLLITSLTMFERRLQNLNKIRQRNG